MVEQKNIRGEKIVAQDQISTVEHDFNECSMDGEKTSQGLSVFHGTLESNSILHNALCHPWYVNNSELSTNEDLLGESASRSFGKKSELSGVTPLILKKVDGSKFSENTDVPNLDGWWHESSIQNSFMEPYFETSSPLSFWGSCPLDIENMKMDDVFQVDKDDLVLSPTLAELNANDESLFDTLNCFDLPDNNFMAFISNDNKSPVSDENIEFKICSNKAYKKKGEEMSPEANMAKSLHNTSLTFSNTKKDSDVLEILTSSKHNFKGKKMQSMPVVPFKPSCPFPVKNVKQKNNKASQKSSTQLPVIEKPVDIPDVKQILKAEEEFSEEDYSEMEDSSDFGIDSDEESKYYQDKDVALKNFLEKKKSRYFWQYNLQSKGPKGIKMVLSGKCSNNSDLPSVTDPVFSSSCPIRGVKHSGKARKGDGNDLTPNPKKLYNIGFELEKLNSLIDHLTPANELPVNARTKSRKEKNKLASRACRLKKKAQHEANKLKLFGLQQEQKHLLTILTEVRKVVAKKILNPKNSNEESIVDTVHTLCKKNIPKVAGCSADFVNQVLKFVDSGDDTGGLSAIMLKK